MSSEDDKYTLKMVLAGDGAVGKTSLRMQYLGYGFKAQYLETVGADFALKQEDVFGKTVEFTIWDLAGQQRFQSVRTAYYRGALAALVVFDITRWQTFKNLGPWINEIWKNNGSGIIPVVILGNKYDLREQALLDVEEQEVLDFCTELSKKTQEEGFDVKFFYTSAKTGLNVKEAFQALAQVYFNSL
ncbi:MAG: Rab family GTPase [Candidatus Odinarchaeota archaeon]